MRGPGRGSARLFVCMNGHKSQTNMDMKQEKQYYISPEVDIFEVKTEGVICGSLTDPDDYNNAPDPFGF